MRNIPFGQFLIQKNLITKEDLDKALRFQKTKRKHLGELLKEMGMLSEKDFLENLSEYLEIPFVLLKDLPEESILPENLSINFLKQYQFIPISFETESNTMKIAMVDPTDLNTIDDLQLTLNCELEVYLMSQKDLGLAIESLLEQHSSAMDQIIDDMADEELEIYATDEIDDEDHLRDMASEAPIIRLVNLIITNAVERDASDIHIEPFETELRVRYRIDGVLHNIDPPPKKMQAAVISRIKIMSELNIAERRLPQDGRIRIRVEGKKLDLRVSTIPTMYGESVVMRLLDQSSSLKTLQELGFAPDTFKNFEHIIQQPHGIILVTGPTGSGKTTTLYAALDKLNAIEKKIITVEDPVEYQLHGVNQIQARPNIGLTFARGLRHIVRQDPDIILIGEIRDLETAQIAIQSSLTGHLVLSTIHTNDAPGAITRLLDMGVENFLVSSTLAGALAQRLVRVICPKCKDKAEPDPVILKKLEVSEGMTIDFTVYEGHGCEYCGHTGYRGRCGIYELLIIDDEIRKLILDKSTSTEILRVGKKRGMRTLRDDCWLKVKEGVTTIDELLRVTQEEETVFEVAS